MRRTSRLKFLLARQSLGVPGTGSFRPFGAMIFPCFVPAMYRHPVFISFRTMADISLSLLYRMVMVRISATSDADPFPLLGALRRTLVVRSRTLCPCSKGASIDLPAVDLSGSRLDASSALAGHGRGLGRRIGHENPFNITLHGSATDERLEIGLGFVCRAIAQIISISEKWPQPGTDLENARMSKLSCTPECPLIKTGTISAVHVNQVLGIYLFRDR